MPITKNVVFEESDYATLVKTARKRGLGPRGISAALRQIIREWNDLQADADAPTPYYVTEKGRDALEGGNGDGHHG
jgi:hypothetical protein